jgi:hypothetical protein
MPWELLILHHLQLLLKLRIKRIVPLIINGERQLGHLSLVVLKVLLAVFLRDLILDLLNQRSSLRVLVDHGDHLDLRIIVAAKSETTYYKPNN